ncbi:MAG: hypothetical protein E7262_05860 [Lachnospiraceae bacterium]|nr:hypothetical protein [Lachnospiraceae bacterium]
MVSRKHNYILWITVVLMICATVAYVIGYNTYIRKYGNQFNSKVTNYNDAIKVKNSVDRENVSNEIDTFKEKEDEELIDEEDTSTAVFASEAEKINNRTEFTTIVIDKKNKTTDKDTEDAPLHLIGLTKVQLAKYYEYYINNLPTEEMAKGLLSVRVMNFSEDEVVIQKIYDESTVLYYITENDGLVKVYYSDKETLYESTGIFVEDLPPIEQKNIKNGMYVENKDELISILEGYSS